MTILKYDSKSSDFSRFAPNLVGTEKLRIELVSLSWHSLPAFNNNPQQGWDKTPLFSNINAYNLGPQELLTLPAQPIMGSMLGAGAAWVVAIKNVWRIIKMMDNFMARIFFESVKSNERVFLFFCNRICSSCGVSLANWSANSTGGWWNETFVQHTFIVYARL